jgi:penicillin-binding protein 2
LYPPGSIIKPLVLAAAVTEGELEPDESIECVGHFFKDVKDVARCWIYRPVYKNRTHGHLKSVEAIARSCNIFFYELGTRMGFEKLLEWLQRFGMSQPVASQLSGTTSTGTLGHVPSDEDIESLRARGALAFETISISIGQGALTWSPLHAAAAYATLARGGVWIPPSLVVGLQHEETDLHLNKEGVTLALGGLHDSISKKHGTGSRIRYGTEDSEPTFTMQGIRLWGKTGTAEAPPYRLNKESEPISGLDHSWFLVMASEAGGSEPKFVVAVLVEHGGSGGRVAGPIANQILYSLQSEGYLEGESQ